MVKLLLITGTSGTGKTSVIPNLNSLLNKNYAIYDFDEIYRPYDFSEEWEDEVITKCFEVAHENSKLNKSTVILGLIRPWKLIKYSEEIKNSLEFDFLLLDVNIETRTDRLEKRGARKSLILDSQELYEFKEWFSKNKGDSFDTSDLALNQVAQNIRNWVVNESS